MSTNLPSIIKTVFPFFLFMSVKATAQPTISSFNPSSGTVGTSVIITGTNFNAVPLNNVVYFGAVKAIVIAGTTTNLTVAVPAGATYQPISVLNNATGLTGYSSKPFITTFTNLSSGVPADFYNPKVDFVAGTNPRNVAIGDLDGDGKPELVISNGNSSTLSVLRNTSTLGSISASSFAAKVDFATGTFLAWVAIGDVDGDGKPDLVFIQNGLIAVMRNTSTPGTLSFAPIITFTPIFGGSNFVSIVDIDGDGKPELVSTNLNATMSVVRNTSTPGTLSFAAKIDFVTGGSPASIAFADVDGDGKPDAVTANSGTSANSVSVLRNTSISGIINASSFAAKVDFAAGAAPLSVAIGDVDGDGKPDLVVANSQPSTTISVLRNTATSGIINAASFAPKVEFITAIGPRFVAVDDVSGDGKLDVVVVGSIQNSHTISVLRNTSTSGSISATSFAPKVDFAAGLGPVTVAIGDLNGDGIAELAVANGAGSSVSVFQANNLVLPVTITDVKAYQKNAGVQIEWTMHQEYNIDRYELERSKNGQQFSQLASALAKGSNSIVTTYNLFDPNPLNGVNFYRIKTIDKSGQVTYSRLMKVNISSGITQVTVFPNPVNGNTIAFQINNLKKGSYTLTLTNKAGQQIINKVIKHTGGSATETLDFSKANATGVYSLQLSGEGISITQQVIKN